MRLRNIKGSMEAVKSHQSVIQDPETYKGRWHEYFGNNHPIHIEIGMGKGQFIMQHAKQNPMINYIGIEKYSGILFRALKQIDDFNLNNLTTLRTDALWLEDIFLPNEIQRIYLNFSDPWPKDRHAKRRLTYKTFLQIYHTLLTEDGEVHFKTDNQDLFEFSVESFTSFGYEISYLSRDLHQAGIDNIMTEYEEKFSSMGYKINKLIAKNFVN